MLLYDQTMASLARVNGMILRVHSMTIVERKELLILSIRAKRIERQEGHSFILYISINSNDQGRNKNCCTTLHGVSDALILIVMDSEADWVPLSFLQK